MHITTIIAEQVDAGTAQVHYYFDTRELPDRMWNLCIVSPNVTCPFHPGNHLCVKSMLLFITKSILYRGVSRIFIIGFP